nr:S41 family peptidase [Bowmanella yangjiangensis]
MKQEIAKQYVLDEKKPAILDSLEILSSSEELERVSSDKEFAEAIANDLKKFDKHFSFSWKNDEKIDANQPSESYWERLERKNSGFSKVEILEGNVGYIDFWGFDKVNSNSTERVANVMSMVADTSAIIFDLRNNGGGHPEMSQLISSYLFKNRTHLNSIYWRDSGEVDEFWTFRKVKGKKLVDIPIYILTSSKTFSAAEDFAYSLQSLKRAVVVGEVTGGGAHPMRFLDFGNGFVAGIPYGKAINPVTKTNWEWVGVKPDLVSSKDSAFSLAYYTVLENLVKTELNFAAKNEIRDKLQELSKTLGTEL